MSALPYAIQWLCSFPVGFLSDKLINSGLVSKAVSRKLFNSLYMYGSVIGLVWLSFVRCDQALAVVALCFSVAVAAGKYAGVLVNENHTDTG